MIEKTVNALRISECAHFEKINTYYFEVPRTVKMISDYWKDYVDLHNLIFKLKKKGIKFLMKNLSICSSVVSEVAGTKKERKNLR